MSQLIEPNKPDSKFCAKCILHLPMMCIVIRWKTREKNEIQLLCQKNSMNSEAIANISDQPCQSYLSENKLKRNNMH